jgi:hypothetical protein
VAEPSPLNHERKRMGRGGMISLEKIRLALGYTVIYGGLVLAAWACGFVVGLPPPWLRADAPRRSAEQVEFADDCLEWSAMSSISRLLAGPDLAKECRDYFKSRSEEDRVDDNARWRKRQDDARTEWLKGESRSQQTPHGGYFDDILKQPAQPAAQ